MTDKNTNTTTGTNNNLTFPTTKPLLQNSNRQPYLRPPHHHRRRRSCCCSFCLFITFLLFLLIIIAAIAGGVFYLIYRPHRPSFTNPSLQISQFNLTTSNQLNTNVNFTLTAHNPNKKISFYFTSISVSLHANGEDIGDGTIPSFELRKKNTTKLVAHVSSTGQSVEKGGELETELRNKKSVKVVIWIDMKVRVKVGGVKIKKVPVRVVCKGINIIGMKASGSDVKCKVDLRVKIWKWRI